jgi:NADH-quinone oxidoreductase subunit J
MYTLIHNLFFYYVALFETLALITISVQNPIHAILSLMGCFFAGSILLATLNLDYFALLFLIVYVGAIVVLFLFIIMFMDLKMTHIKLNLKALFNLYT